MKRCPYCDHEIVGNPRYCQFCGADNEYYRSEGNPSLVLQDRMRQTYTVPEIEQKPVKPNVPEYHPESRPQSRPQSRPTEERDKWIVYAIVAIMIVTAVLSVI